MEPVYSMSVAGVLTEGGPKVDRLLAYYQTSDAHQSNGLHKDYSLLHTLSIYGGDGAALCSQVQEEVGHILRPHFDTENVTVTPYVKNKVNYINIAIVVTSGGVKVDVLRAIAYDNASCNILSNFINGFS